MAEVEGTDPGDGISGFGTTLKGATTGVLGMLIKLAFAGQEVNDIDITTMNNADRWKKFIAGLKDSKELNVDLLYEPENTGIILAHLGAAPENFTVTFPDGATWVQKGYIKSLGTQIPLDDKIMQSMTIRLSGPPAFHEPS